MLPGGQISVALCFLIFCLRFLFVCPPFISSVSIPACSGPEQCEILSIPNSHEDPQTTESTLLWVTHTHTHTPHIIRTLIPTFLVCFFEVGVLWGDAVIIWSFAWRCGRPAQEPGYFGFRITHLVKYMCGRWTVLSRHIHSWCLWWACWAKQHLVCTGGIFFFFFQHFFSTLLVACLKWRLW